MNDYTHKLKQIALVTLLLLIASAIALSTAAYAATTNASVTFTDGSLTWDDNPPGSKLNFDFGSHPLPATEFTQTAVNKSGEDAVDHVLKIIDTRAASGNWHVKVSMGAFVPSSGNVVNALIKLDNPVVENDNPDGSMDGLHVEDNISILSDEFEVLVMEADDTLARGVYAAKWTNDHVTLKISGSEVGTLSTSDYTATLTWTLANGPFGG